MKRFTLGEGNAPPRANNDNYIPTYCAEVFTPNVGWTIYVRIMNIGPVDRYTLEEFIALIYRIENSRRRNPGFQQYGKDLRVCLERIKSYGVLS